LLIAIVSITRWKFPTNFFVRQPRHLLFFLIVSACAIRILQSVNPRNFYSVSLGASILSATLPTIFQPMLSSFCQPMLSLFCQLQLLSFSKSMLALFYQSLLPLFIVSLTFILSARAIPIQSATLPPFCRPTLASFCNYTRTLILFVLNILCRPRNLPFEDLDGTSSHAWRLALVPVIPRLQTFLETCTTTGRDILRTGYFCVSGISRSLLLNFSDPDPL
jgi:hypothetical protein